jgi:hypothetical protein
VYPYPERRAEIRLEDGTVAVEPKASIFACPRKRFGG